jgi:hypothetical protein
MKNVSWLFFVTQHCKIGLTLGRACSNSSIPRVCIRVGISRLDPEGLRFRTRFELSSVSPEIVSLDRLGQLWVTMEKLTWSVRASEVSTHFKADFEHRFLLWRVLEGGCMIMGWEHQYFGEYTQ